MNILLNPKNQWLGISPLTIPLLEQLGCTQLARCRFLVPDEATLHRIGDNHISDLPLLKWHESDDPIIYDELDTQAVSPEELVSWVTFLRNSELIGDGTGIIEDLYHTNFAGDQHFIATIITCPHTGNLLRVQRKRGKSSTFDSCFQLTFWENFELHKKRSVKNLFRLKRYTHGSVWVSMTQNTSQHGYSFKPIFKARNNVKLIDCGFHQTKILKTDKEMNDYLYQLLVYSENVMSEIFRVMLEFPNGYKIGADNNRLPKNLSLQELMHVAPGKLDHLWL